MLCFRAGTLARTILSPLPCAFVSHSFTTWSKPRFKERLGLKRAAKLQEQREEIKEEKVQRNLMAELGDEKSFLQPSMAIKFVPTQCLETGWIGTINAASAGLQNDTDAFLPVKEIFSKEVKEGQEIDAFVLRTGAEGGSRGGNGNTIVTLSEPGFRARMNESQSALMLALEANNGQLPLGDKSDEKDIRAALNISKSNFKAAAGVLQKRGILTITDDSVKLTNVQTPKDNSKQSEPTRPIPTKRAEPPTTSPSRDEEPAAPARPTPPKSKVAKPDLAKKHSKPLKAKEEGSENEDDEFDEFDDSDSEGEDVGSFFQKHNVKAKTSSPPPHTTKPFKPEFDRSRPREDTKPWKTAGHKPTEFRPTRRPESAGFSDRSRDSMVKTPAEWNSSAPRREGFKPFQPKSNFGKPERQFVANPNYRREGKPAPPWRPPSADFKRGPRSAPFPSKGDRFEPRSFQNREKSYQPREYQPREYQPRDKSEPRAYQPREYQPRDKPEPRAYQPRDKSEPRAYPNKEKPYQPRERPEFKERTTPEAYQAKDQAKEKPEPKAKVKPEPKAKVKPEPELAPAGKTAKVKGKAGKKLGVKSKIKKSKTSKKKVAKKSKGGKKK